MIPVATNMSEVDTLPGEEVQFTIGDPRWVMRSLADLYSNRELAVIREYSTNARDAMDMAGKKNYPISITLPTVLNPYFTVTDTGVGMSETVLKERYTKFGDSDKRDNVDANGMLGFGCKSAVAYTNTFTVTSVYDGFKTVAVISRKEDYTIILKVIAHVATSEANGTKVEIPVANPRSFEQVAKDFYRFWKPGLVLVDGKQPEWTVGDKIGDDLFMYPKYGTSYVVMGNVPYRIANPDALFPRGMRKISFVAYVPTGAVEFTPNREDLKYSDHTKRNLHGIIDKFVATALETARKEINGAATHWDAYSEWVKWREIVGTDNVANLEFKGDKFIDTFDIDGMLYNANRSRNNANRIYQKKYSVSEMNNTVIVTGFTPQLASAHKRRARDWADVKNISASRFIFTVAPTFANVWVNPVRVVSWEQVKIDVPTPKKPRVAGNNANWGRKAGTFDLLTKNGYQREADIPENTKLYYIGVQELKTYSAIKDALVLLNDDATVVVVPANRKGKFLREYSATHILDHLRPEVTLDGPSLIDADAKKIMEIEQSDLNFLKALAMDKERVEDPEVKALITLAEKSKNDLMVEYNKHYRLAYWLGLGDKFKRYTPVNDYYGHGKKTLTNLYPLASAQVYRLKREHVLCYMNALYRARKEGKNV